MEFGELGALLGGCDMCCNIVSALAATSIVCRTDSWKKSCDIRCVDVMPVGPRRGIGELLYRWLRPHLRGSIGDATKMCKDDMFRCRFGS